MRLAKVFKGGVVCLGLGALSAGCSREVQEQSVDLTVPVTVQSVGRGTIEALLSATGTLRPVREAEVMTEARGFLYFGRQAGGGALRVGLRVEEGQPLARLESEELTLNARLTSRELALASARKAFKDQESLYKRGMVSQTEVDAARKAWVDAQSDYDNALLQLKKKAIPAPIGGVISEFTEVTEGTIVEQGQLICRIVDYGTVLIDLRIPSSQIRRVALDQEVRVIDYAYPDESFSGRIRALDPVVDPTTRTFKVVAAVDNPEYLLRPGMFVKAEIVVEARRDIVVVPRQYVLTRNNQPVVFVEENARAQMRSLETGLEDETHIEVVGGLDEGERLITSNHETLRPRARVRVAGVDDGDGGR